MGKTYGFPTGSNVIFVLSQVTGNGAGVAGGDVCQMDLTWGFRMVSMGVAPVILYFIDL